MKKVTIGIPVYNDAKNIGHCLETIINQSFPFSDIEIICVDDGSTDQTPSIIKEYQKKHNINGNINYLRHENTGNPTKARNRIIESAEGEYIFFVDGDDYIGLEAVEKMYTLGKRKNAEVVIGRYKGVNRGVPVVMFQKNKESTNFFDSNVIDSLNVLKMFKTKFLREHNIKFNPNINHAEDHPFTMKAYLYANVISIVNDYDCYYWTRYTDGNRTQMTKQLISVAEFYKYFYETLDTIRGLELDDDRKIKALAKYWRRLLIADIPNEFRRNRTDEDKRHSYATVSEIANKYINHSILNNLSEKEVFYHKLISNGDYELFDAYQKVK
ncbi:glycosyltransferase [Cytobacillus horneckiae]|uniref:glycosyltransferase n=1 Tax=Cytobacillus horneckiae TaxID=549687 RepID=UPI003D260FD8